MRLAKHLFILSGQSNMQRLKVAQSFAPIVAKALGSDRVLIVKEAWGGQPIRRWCKDWHAVPGVAWPDREHRRLSGDLYQRLMQQVTAAVAGQSISGVSFIWMQGEEDAVEHLAAAYQSNLQALLKQLCDDLNISNELQLVLGKLNDYGLDSPLQLYWRQVQAAQVQIAAERADTALVLTSDLSLAEDGLHFSGDGYHQLGQRFAAAALKLLEHSKA